MKLNAFDRTLIHGLGLMSRLPLIPDEADFRMLAEIIDKAAPRATRSPEMEPLLREARRIADNLGPHRAIEHYVARAMNDFDRRCMAAHWNAARRPE
ncbi:hypothetical protein J7376_19650 [Paracoccus sp. R12_1]|uniref:hypothetical protein n=1 Tax=unclassified Paracoccus (in: a-proteobacteria) TaxID=2688777 RepID=UPI001AD9D097|nr:MULTISPECIES: hypothetical protein [unclassified Paracoccus (in: a-proteobacteria)]MBO9457314.1 hypothetical protein [Paracoccus sp. R12_2]MBO9488706.1 hypothetical protein [Paracoccus sp. R12_1]MBO9488718.1 hypothetical protein [Paracoccus sp. R12_1]